LIRFLKKMEILEAFRFQGSVQNDRAETIACPSLKILWTRDEGILRYLRIPNLTSLKIWGIINSKEIVEAPFDRSFASSVQLVSMQACNAELILMDGSDFTRLHSLRLFNPIYEYGYPSGSLPALTEISFDMMHGSMGASHLCELLLRYPRTCPCLKTIRIYGYPEWDMLLYMLLRRNVYHSRDHISRITNIEVPGYPGPSILVPLSALLLGKLPLEMPSPEELSFGAIADISFDPTISGCMDCIDCRLVCSTPVPPYNPMDSIISMDRPYSRLGDKRAQGSDPPLPEYLQTWVDDWPERTGAWERRPHEMEAYRRRKNQCARHDYSQLVVIDGHTLDGAHSLTLFYLRRIKL
ncbi:hypothetical protein CPB86DRAFT_673293, partial [Serendipita vermifera]